MGTFEIKYRLEPAGKPKEEIVVRVDEDTLLHQPEPYKGTPPDWAKLDFQKCPHCPLTAAKTPYCPVAMNYARLAPFADKYRSFVDVTVFVITPDRTIARHCDIQTALASLLGLMGATSTCPKMAFFRPMAGFHLPFASMKETLYRVISMYLMAQYLREKEGLKPDWKLDGLAKIYADVETANSYVAKRLQTSQQTDANANAVIALDLFAKAAQMSINDPEFWDFVHFFKPYTQKGT